MTTTLADLRIGRAMAEHRVRVLKERLQGRAAYHVLVPRAERALARIDAEIRRLEARP